MANRSHAPAFTLIELLVVIAIIAILAAILFPVFAKAREKARQSSCASNAKQAALATLQYVQDYDERFPEHGPFWSRQLGLGWYVHAYVKNAQVWRCPSDTVNTGAVETATYRNVSYAYNSYKGIVKGDALAAIDAPSGVDLLHGAWGNLNYVFVFDNISAASSVAALIEGSPIVWPAYQPVPGHSAGGNFAYCDGHAKWLPTGVIGNQVASGRAYQNSIFCER